MPNTRVDSKVPSPTPSESISFRAMGSPCTLQLEGATKSQCATTTKIALREIARLENKYSRYRPDSLASRINRSAGSACGICIDDETTGLLDFAATAHRESGGRFDPTSGVLRRVWDFKSGRLPSRREIEGTLRLVGWSKLRWERPHLTPSHRRHGA